MRPSHNSFLSIILESVAGPVQSSIAVNHPYADGRVEWKKSVNEAVALLVLESTMLLKRIGCPPYRGPSDAGALRNKEG